jgi:small subunit ribosomal protein S8
VSVDIVANALNTIKTHEMVGRRECTVPFSKLIENVLSILKREGYIEDFAFVDNGRGGEFKVVLSGKINNIGVIKPRFPVKKDEWQKFEVRYLPAYNIGLLIVSTSQGVMTNYEARKRGIGGRLIAYVY